jgi:hypothetical protein
MKKTIIAVSVALAATTAAFAFNTPVYAPDSQYTTRLTINSTTVNMTGRTMYGVYVPYSTVTCFARTMPSALTAKAAYAPTVVPLATWHIRGVNAAAPFLNLSGCRDGYLERM